MGTVVACDYERRDSCSMWLNILTIVGACEHILMSDVRCEM